MKIFLGIVGLLFLAAIKLGMIFLACSLYDDFKEWRKNKAKVVIKVNGNTVYVSQRKSDNQK